MRRAVKYSDSEILLKSLTYSKGNSANNRKVADVLLKEQKGFCAYTDEPISRTSSADIEHFNPTLKNSTDDNYNNWFLVKHKWNQQKSYKWKNYQPILYPTAEDFEKRVLYLDGDYISNDSDDIEAQNVIDLLKLDGAGLADERKRYIKRKREEIKIYGQDSETYFQTLINDNPIGVSYLRAIQEEFDIDIWEMLP